MRSFLIISIFFIALIQVRGQNINFQEIDSTSEILFNQQKWNELSDLGVKAINQDIDYFKIQLYTGIAFYMQEKYYLSITHLKKALIFNSANPIAQYYLFLAYFDTGNDFMASEMFIQLPDSIKQNIDFNSKSIISFLYPEGGVKISNNQTNAKNIIYWGFVTAQKPKHNISLIESYTGLSQKLIWGDYKQNQFALSSYYYLGKGFSLGVSGQYSLYKNNMDYKTQTTDNPVNQYVENQINYVFDTLTVIDKEIKGIFKQNIFAANISIHKEIGRWSFGIGSALFIENIKSTINTTYDVNYVNREFQNSNLIYLWDTTYTLSWRDSNSTVIHILPRINVGLHISHWLKLNLETFVSINRNEYNWVFIPGFTLKLLKNTWLSGYYVSKTSFPALINEGNILFTGYNLYDYRLSLTLDTKISKNISAFLTYQNEKNNDIISDETYHLNSVILGIKLTIWELYLR